MSALSDWAARVQGVAEHMEAGLAVDVARAQGDKFIEIEQMVTPKRSGALAGSEHLDAVVGGGSHAVAIGGPHKIYAEIENDGGVISAHAGLGRKGMRPHTLHWDGGGFPLHVTHAGKHYVQRAEGAAAGPLAGLAEQVLAFYLDGL